MKNDILGTWQRHRAALWTCSVVMSKWTCTFLLFLEGCLLLWFGWPASRLDIDKGLPRLSPWLESSSCLGELWPDFCLCLGYLSNKTSLATECKGLSLAGLAGDSESWFGSSCKMMSLVFSSPNHILSKTISVTCCRRLRWRMTPKIPSMVARYERTWEK